MRRPGPVRGGHPDPRRTTGRQQDRGAEWPGTRQPQPSNSINSAVDVTGRSQTNPRQTYAAGTPPTSGRPASNSRPGSSGRPTSMTDPAGACHRAARASSSLTGPGSPLTATCSGPARNASAAARCQPAERGNRCTNSETDDTAASAKARYAALPVNAAAVSRAWLIEESPEGAAPSVGSRGRRISTPASSAVSKNATGRSLPPDVPVA